MSVTALAQSAVPLIAAPMAGGPSTVALAAAVASAGAFPFLAGGNKSASALADEVAQLRHQVAPGTGFGVNLFVPSKFPMDPAAFARYRADLVPDAERFGLQLETEPLSNDDAWHEKLDLLISDPVPVVSFTFGLPSAEEVTALQRAGSTVLTSVTSAAEAVASQQLGVDGVVAQGAAAGGHSAIHSVSTEPDLRDASLQGTLSLLREVAAAVQLPVISAGGVDGPRAVRDLIAAGAAAVAVGTLLIRTPESGAAALHKYALGHHANGTALTRAFTGRPARALRNRFIDEHDAVAPAGYPEVHLLTRELRATAMRAGDADTAHLWAGTGYASAREMPAADVIADLASLIPR